MTPKICKGDPHLIREARVSFPSGHSSFTTFSMLFVIVSSPFNLLTALVSNKKLTYFYDWVVMERSI